MTKFNINTSGINAMRDGLPPEAHDHFDRFIERAKNHDFLDKPIIREQFSLRKPDANPREKAKDTRLLLLRAFIDHSVKQIRVHVRIYFGGQYGILCLINE